MKRAVIFVNGELADIQRLRIRKTDLLIGVDGGTNQIEKPDLVIGDLDSLKTIPENVPVIKYPTDKDFTDTELALEYCQKIKAKEIIMVGFLGRRLDHLIANLMSLSKYKFKIIEGNQEISICKDKAEITGKKGDSVSLIPLLGDCQGVTTVGLKWRLQGCSLQVGSSLGVSNVMLGKSAKVGLKKGCLLVIVSRLGLEPRTIRLRGECSTT